MKMEGKDGSGLPETNTGLDMSGVQLLALDLLDTTLFS